MAKNIPIRLIKFFIPRFEKSRFADVTPLQARIVLACFILLIGAGLLCCYVSPPVHKEKSPDAIGDAQAYRNILNRVRDGQNYYDVVGDELRTNNYATKPFFNWKLPLLTLFLAKLPTADSGRWVLGALAIIMLIKWVHLLCRDDKPYLVIPVTVLLLTSVIAGFTDSGYFFYEMWAGVLIALSIAFYQQSRFLSIALGLTALFIRELTLPFAVIMMALAYFNGEKRQAYFWLTGIIIFFIYLGIHGWIVSGHITEADVKNQSWVKFGGLSFVFLTMKWNTVTLFAPCRLDALILPLALAGLAGWKGPVGNRVALTAAAYLTAFLFVGRQVNDYWGLMYAPLLPLGLIYTPRSVYDLFRVSLKTGNKYHGP